MTTKNDKAIFTEKESSDVLFPAKGVANDWRTVATDKGVSIVEYYGAAGSEIVIIPERIDGKVVVDISSEGYVPVFNNFTKLLKIIIPKSVKTVSPYAFNGCPNLLEIEVDKRNKKLVSKNGVLYTFGKNSKLIFIPPGLVGRFTIPDEVVAFAHGAFCGTKLDEILILSSPQIAALKEINDDYLVDPRKKLLAPIREKPIVRSPFLSTDKAVVIDAAGNMYRASAATLSINKNSQSEKNVDKSAELVAIELKELARTIGAGTMNGCKKLAARTLAGTIALATARGLKILLDDANTSASKSNDYREENIRRAIITIAKIPFGEFKKLNADISLIAELLNERIIHNRVVISKLCRAFALQLNGTATTGKAVCIVGPNCTGKTLLAKLFAELAYWELGLT